MKIQIIPIKIGDMNTNEIVIENSQKIKVAFLTYCGIITKFEVPDSNGNFENIIKHQKDNLYDKNSLDYGNIIMITSDKSSLLDKKEYIFMDDMEIFSKSNISEYEFETFREKDLIRVSLKSTTLHSNGFNINKIIKYSLDEENNFLIDYEIESEKSISLNIFNNLSFNIRPEDEEGILNHRLLIPSKFFYQISSKEAKIRKLSVEKTPFDFSYLRAIKDGVNSHYGRIHKNEVYNTLFELENMDIEPTVSIYQENSKRFLNITTNNTHIFVNSNNISNNEFINIRFYDFILNDKWMRLEFPVITPDNKYHKFINYNFKIM
ncbi:aldose epimerase family protein [Peptoanaerobacter stomatis]|jgi:hypothetical protein|uniref:aldose epimerase family protein n=1 Tax=Peptoanaerobacter stomatis TaxID=796937 RepID=UPI003FA0D955